MITKNIYKSSKPFFMLLLLGGFYGVQASVITVTLHLLKTGEKKEVSVDTSEISNMKKLKKLAYNEFDLNQNKKIEGIRLLYDQNENFEIKNLKNKTTVHVILKMKGSSNTGSLNQNNNNEPNKNNNEGPIDPNKKTDITNNKNNDTTTPDEPNKDNNDGTFWSRNKWYIILGSGGFVILVAGVTMVVYSKNQEEEK